MSGKRSWRGFWALMVTAALLAGCASIHERVDEMKDDVEHDHSEAQEEIKKIQNPDTYAGAFQVKEGVWFLDKSRGVVRKQPLPDVFEQRVTLNSAQPTDLPSVIDRVSDLTSLPVKLDQDLLTLLQQETSGGDPLGTPHRIQYSGSLKGLLTRITSHTNTYWTFRDDAIWIYRMQSRTFRLASIPGQSNLETGVSREGTRRGQGMDEAKEGGIQGSGRQSTQLLAKNLSVWSSIYDGVKSMLSEQGTVVLSEAAGTLTVTDQPPILDRVKKYIRQQNIALMKQVTVNVRLLSLTLSDIAQFGIDWDLLVDALDDKLNIQTTQAFQLTQQENAGLLSLTVPAGANDLEGSEAIVRALREQGDVSVVTQASVVTLNNQPAPLQIVRETAFLAEVSQTQAPDVGTTNSLTPGTVTTGFSMVLLPHILDHGQVMLQFSINLSNLVDIREVSSGGLSIQTPEVDSLDFMQKATLRPGETLVLSGFEQTETDVEESGSWWPETGRKGTQNKDIRVLLITPSLKGA